LESHVDCDLNVFTMYPVGIWALVPSVTYNSRKITQIAATYHNNLQYTGQDPLKLDTMLSNLKMKLSDKNKSKLHEKIMEEEVRYAIKKTNNEKAPGLDSIPIELWKTMDD